MKTVMASAALFSILALQSGMAQEAAAELGEPKSADMNDQSIDLEDDEVLESLGMAAQKEISLLNLAMERIKDGSFGICKKCEEPISEARLNAVLYAPLCKHCATQS